MENEIQLYDPNAPGDPDTKLTELQQMFVHYHVHDRMTIQAASRAINTPHTTVRKWMQYKNMQKAVALARQEYAEATKMSRKKVIDGFMEAIDMGRIKADPLAMISGWREIAKLCGYYEPTKHKVEISVNGKVQLERINNMTDDELIQLLESENPANALEGEFTHVSDEDDPTQA